MSDPLVEAAERRAKRILDDEASVIQPSPLRIQDARAILQLAQMWRDVQNEAEENKLEWYASVKSTRNECDRADAAEAKLARIVAEARAACAKPCSCGLSDWPCHVDGDQACDLVLWLAQEGKK